ncbi:MAG: M23 family metallopeptidase [Treponema sp.]|nr:M23 family metallopeptidase [Treponema sp.]
MIFSGPLVLLMVLIGLFSHNVLAAEATHIVVRGDTIFSLSRSHGISQEELMRRNGMTDPSQLRIGMRLSIPAQSHHTVSPGETLFSIARSRGVTIQALRDANGFSQDRVLRAGERIRIPLSTLPPAVAVNPATSVPLAPARITTGRRADPSLRWPIQATEVVYMSGNSGGVLILGRESDSVRSISRGTVVYAGPWRGYGNVVIVESAGGFRFLYGAKESLSVRIGDVVEPGTEVGKLGIHPASGRPELVFIVSRNGIPVDPATAPRS